MITLIALSRLTAMKANQTTKKKGTTMNPLIQFKKIRVLLPLIASALVAGAFTSAAAAPQPQYTVIDLGEGVGNVITDSSQIVGTAPFHGDAAFWPSPQSPAIDLGTLPGFTGSRALGINPRGQIVGTAVPSVPGVPLFWANSQSAPMELAGLPEGFIGMASSINPAGHIVGTFYDLDGLAHAVFWANSNAAAIYLSELTPNSLAISINPAGNIFGDGCDADFVECHAAFWASSARAPVALASPGGDFIYTDVALSSGPTTSSGLNNAGSMVGYAYNADFSATRAVFWASSTSPAVILSTTEAFPNGTAEGISDNGQAVGTAYNSDFSDSHAFVWPNSNSPGVDLNTLIPSDSGWELQIARCVNNRGEITGYGLLNGIVHAYALIPVHGCR
jgi:probable HAF family extracellular repeat protein